MNDIMKTKFDVYTIKARILPMIIAMLPIGLSAYALLDKWYFGLFWGIFSTSIGAILCSQLGRDLGKKKEHGLFKLWGGPPSTRLLRYKDTDNKVRHARWHNRLGEIVPHIKLPSKKEEEMNPTEADEIYETCVAFLREKTRDKDKFNLIFEENCNYGFRRNLWGLKPVGILLACLGVVLISLLSLRGIILSGITIKDSVFIGGIGILLIIILWLTVVTKNWVKLAADAYAEQLVASIDNLEIT